MLVLIVMIVFISNSFIVFVFSSTKTEPNKNDVRLKESNAEASKSSHCTIENTKYTRQLCDILNLYANVSILSII